ncbi:MAG: hypothetical protein AB1638_11770, partial [Nitrospirota bacterium]
VEVHYYRRVDYKTPAEFINKNLLPGEKVFSTIVPVAFYLKKMDVIYLNKDHPDFMGVLTEDGVREIWTGSKLIYDFDEFIRKIADEAPTGIWLLIRSPSCPRVKPEEVNLFKRFKESEVFTSLDGRVKVLNIHFKTQPRI